MRSGMFFRLTSGHESAESQRTRRGQRISSDAGLAETRRVRTVIIEEIFLAQRKIQHRVVELFTGKFEHLREVIVV